MVAIPSDGLESMRSSTVPWTEGWSAASLRKIAIALPVTKDFGNLLRDFFGFLIPPMASSFSLSLSVFAPKFSSGAWKSVQGSGSLWSSLNLRALCVSTFATAAEMAEFNLAGYSPNAFEARSL